jgi:hypothetical protein
MRWMRVGMAAALCAAGLLAWAGAAGAGEYHVYSCRTPSGAVAPTDGWTGSASGVSVVAEDKCAKGGALIAGLREGISHSVGIDVATWRLNIPSGLQMRKATLWRAGDAEGGSASNATYQFWFSSPTETEVFSECIYSVGCTKATGEAEEPLSLANILAVPTKDLGEHIYVNASCGGLQTYSCPSGKGDANGYAAVVYLYAADLTLEQTAQPLVGAVGGELASASTLSGTADLSLQASDPGAGVYQAVFTVDGAEVGRILLDENGGRCRDVGGTGDGLPAFLYLRPCAASVSADLPFDTTALADGTHHLVVAVTDAAGNSAVALDRKIDVLNYPPQPPSQSPAPSTPAPGLPAPSLPAPSIATSGLAALGAANGTPASAAATLSAHWSGAAARTALTARLGSARALTGRLLAPGGAAIAGATVQAQFLPAYQGAQPRQLTAARTGAGGAFALRLPGSLPSGRLTLSYSSHAGQAVPDVTTALTLTVPASLTLRVTPRGSHAGGTIRFTGALRGGPLPRGGKQVVLEARAVEAGGRRGTHSPWRQFRVLSSSARGAFHASYRFRLPGPVAYQFRAVSPREADYPYARGASNVVRVYER